MITTRMQNAMRKHMPAIRIRGELDFINRHEVNALGERHCLNRADEITRIFRPDTLFACHQSDRAIALLGNNLVVNLTRKQAQRQADHARAIGQHALQCVVSFAGIGRAKYGHELAHGRERFSAFTLRYQP